MTRSGQHRDNFGEASSKIMSICEFLDAIFILPSSIQIYAIFWYKSRAFIIFYMLKFFRSKMKNDYNDDEMLGLSEFLCLEKTNERYLSTYSGTNLG